MEEIHQKLVGLLKRRNTIVEQIHRHTGSLEAARERLASLDSDCRKKGIDPDQLDATIDKLTGRYAQLVEKLEEKVVEAERALDTFIRGE